MKLVDIWASWCGPCKMMEPVLDKLQDVYNIPIEKVNADEHPEYLVEYGVKSIPTLLVFKDEEYSSRIVGYRPLTKLVAELGLETGL